MSEILKYLDSVTKKPYKNNTTTTVGIPSELCSFASIDTDTEIVVDGDFNEDGRPVITLTNKKYKDYRSTTGYSGTEMSLVAGKLNRWAWETRMLLHRIPKNKLRKFLTMVHSAMQAQVSREMFDINEKYVGKTHEEVLEEMVEEIESGR